MNAPAKPDIDELVELLGLQPLPVEGGLFVQTWRSEHNNDIAGTATYAALTDDPDSFSAMHRLPVDEIWHFYLGDAIELLLLHPDGTISAPRLGHDILHGERPQLVVPARTWMGGRLAPGGEWALFGNTMAPGFRSDFYEGGTTDSLIAGWPDADGKIARLIRTDQPTRMPSGL